MKPRLPNKTLTVVIRDDSPLINAGDTPRYRTVQVELTDEQLQKLKLRYSHSSGMNLYYEEISQCFIEPLTE